MNVEENRLQTFSQWPSNAVVSPQRIAKAGFFATQQELEVECFACHVKISTWNYGDQVMARHRTLSPECPFVVNPSTSGNIPRILRLTPSVSSSDLYRNEEVRLASFQNWPATSIVTPESLARAGFYYLKEGDNTKCAYCKGVVRAWEVGDNPDFEHKRHFPTCPFVITTINPRISNSNLESEVNIPKNQFPNVNVVANDIDGNLDELGVHKHTGPKRPNYGTLESRLRTFSSWPRELIQTPELLAQAGFYYEGFGDQVRCFHCEGGLRHWDPHDDPWTEHARWFPRCSFIKLVRGQEFITACALENSQSSLEDVTKGPPRKKREVTERELQEHMLSASALAALSIGINVERVKRAIRTRLEQTGKPYAQPDDLVEAALNLQLDEDEGYEPSTDTDSVASTVSSILGEISKAVTDGSEVLDKALSGSNSSSSGGCSNANNPEKDSQCAVMESKVVATVKTVSLEEENRILKEARLCKICMDGEVGIVFLPCGHLATCVNCAPNLEDCPVCRSAIKATVRTFLS